MIRLFWLGLLVIVELFCIYAIQFNLSYHLPHKKQKTKAMQDYKTGEVSFYEESLNKTTASQDSVGVGVGFYPSYVPTPIHTTKTYYPSNVNGGGLVGMVDTVSHGQQTRILNEHWHMIYYKTLCSKKTWVMSFDVFCWIWWIFYACSLVALFTFWWQSNDLPDFPQVDQFTNSYDLVLLFLVIIRFLSSSWHILFWGSYGEIWWLRIAWLSIFCSFGLGIATLYFMFLVNTLSFGFYTAYVVWLAFVVYYAGTFLSIAYKYRKYKSKMQFM